MIALQLDVENFAHTCCNNTSVFIQLLRDIRADQSVQGLPQRESVQLSY
jgi:hypothetical protein